MHKAEKSADGETFTDIKYNESNTFKMAKKKKKNGENSKDITGDTFTKDKKGKFVLQMQLKHKHGKINMKSSINNKRRHCCFI